MRFSVVSFNLDMNDGILVLNFREVVNVDTLQVSECVLQSSNFNGVLALTYPLSDVNIGQSNIKIYYSNYPIRY